MFPKLQVVCVGAGHTLGMSWAPRRPRGCAGVWGGTGRVQHVQLSAGHVRDVDIYLGCRPAF